MGTAWEDVGMFCEGCGKALNSEARFCSNCGGAISAEKVSTTAAAEPSASAPQQRTSNRYAWFFLLLIPILFSALHVVPAAILTLTIFSWLFVFPHAGISRRASFALMAVAVVIATTIQIFQKTSEPSTPGTAAVSNPPASAWRPEAPAPKFTIYRVKANLPVAVVVPATSTDDELKQLLWYFRNKVKMKEFKDLGIEKATQTQWGNDGYLSGILEVYRGPRCAAEEFTDGAGPCGKGDHYDASYQWGLDGDPNRDVGTVRTSADLATVFDFHDGWKLPPQLQEKLDAREQLELGTRKQFATELQRRLTAKGFDINLRVHGEGIDEGRQLNLESEMFKDTNARVQFINDVLPQWKNDLCRAGFRTVRVTQGGTFETGRDYALGCMVF
jgi:hypothetical protein